MLHGSAIDVGSHPYPYAHLILTTVCPCVVWDKIEFYRLFLCLLDRTVEGACFWRRKLLAVSMHHDLLYRFACYNGIFDKGWCVPVESQQVKICAVVLFFQTVGDRSTGNGGLADVLAHARISVPYLNLHREVEGQCLVLLPGAGDIEVTVFNGIFRAVRTHGVAVCPARNTQCQCKRNVCTIDRDSDFSVPREGRIDVNSDFLTIYLFLNVTSDIQMYKQGVVIFRKCVGAYGA